MLRMYDVQGKLLRGIKSMYNDSSARVKVKGGESKRFRIDMSLWLFNIYMDGVI